MTIEELGLFCRDTLGAEWGINQDGGGSSTLWVQGVVRNLPSDGTERPVANGLMMIAVQPPDNSTRFHPMDAVSTSAPAELRLGPGDNYGVAAWLPEGILGEIADHSKLTNGVLAHGSHWWQVTYSQTTGWVDEAIALPGRRLTTHVCARHLAPHPALARPSPIRPAASHPQKSAARAGSRSARLAARPPGWKIASPGPEDYARQADLARTLHLSGQRGCHADTRDDPNLPPDID